MLTKLEERLLKKIAEANLITKSELGKFLKNSNGSSKDINAIVTSATRNLIEKDLITAINPIGSTCFIITKTGNKLLQDLE